eukprot:scaffold405711_cov14-Prasinocladus_malaysianus.AAC.1
MTVHLCDASPSDDMVGSDVSMIPDKLPQDQCYIAEEYRYGRQNEQTQREWSQGGRTQTLQPEMQAT